MPINKILAEYLDQYHKGEANAVTSRELEYAFGMRGSELRRAVNALRAERIPICSFEGGYYYAATSEEIRRTALQLQSRVNKIAAAARGMIGALPDYEDMIPPFALFLWEALAGSRPRTRKSSGSFLWCCAIEWTA